MNADLYFIAILSRALRDSAPLGALKTAFEEIRELGKQVQFRNGYAQFEAFMAEARRAQVQADDEQQVAEAILSLALDTFEDESERDAAEALIAARPECPKAVDAIRATVTASERSDDSPLMMVIRGDSVVARVSLVAPSIPVESIVPGHYRLQLETGWTIWEGDLTARHLIWRHAFPDAPLPLAAATETAEQRSSLEATLLGGELRLRVIPGLEAGRIEIRRVGGHGDG